MKTIFSFLAISFVLAGTSYAFADTMQGGSMPSDAKMMGSNMSNSSSMMHDNMTSDSMMKGGSMNNMSGWGNGSMMRDNMTGTIMHEGAMMVNGSVDLSMASPVLGSSSAPVTIVEFGDYQCPECGAWFKNQDPIVKTNYIDTQKAKMYFVDFPWAGSDSISAAEASYCAGDQGKYWQYHNYLYQKQAGIQTGWASPSNLKSYATTLGLDTNQFNTCLDSGKYSERVSHNREAGLSKGVQGTPTFFIIGQSGTSQEISGAQPAAVFSSTIDQMSTQPVPEFGSVAALVLVISIMSIVAVSAKTGLRFAPRF